MKAIKMKSDNLVQSWVYVQTEVRRIPITGAVKHMNRCLNTSYRPSRIWNWYNCGDTGIGTQLPRKVRLYMARIVIDYALEAVGVPPSAIKLLDSYKLINMLH